MRHEKIIKREDGSRVRILVECTSSCTEHLFAHWGLGIFYSAPGKRKFYNYDGECPVSEDEAYAVKLELWEKMKPKPY